MIVFIFEGQSYDPGDTGLKYDTSLSLHETFTGAETALSIEKNILLNDGYIIKDYKTDNCENIEYTLTDEFLYERKLTVNKLLVRP
jgi:hypothetical protein